MDHTHLILEAEMGCSHLLSTMETASSTHYDVGIIEGPIITCLLYTSDAADEGLV